MKRLFSYFVCILFVVSLFSTGLVYAAETNEPSLNCAEITSEVAPDEQLEQFVIWGTLAEAKAYYGINWTYGCEGYNVAAGYFLCFYLKADGTKFYFGCYSL